MAERPITRINELPLGASVDDDAYFVAYDPVNEEERYTPSQMADTILKSGIKSVASISALPPATGSGNKVSVTGYHAGTTVGGGELIDFGLARHDGVLYFDPNRPFPDFNVPAEVSAWYADSGVDADCWLRTDGLITDAMAGGTGGYESPAINGSFKYSTDQSVTKVRHKSLAKKIFDATGASTVPAGFCVGNSIMQGAGSSGIGKTIPFAVGAKLQAYTGVATTNDWAPTNKGVGGSNTTLSVAYVASNSDNLGNNSVSGEFVSGKDYALIITLRNDVGQLTVNNSYLSIKRLLSAMVSQGVEPILITDFPEIDMTTGELLDTQANFGDWYDRALIACASARATVVDAWKYFTNLHSIGVDIRAYTDDGIHPNDDGYELISEMIFQAMISQSESLDTDYPAQLSENGAEAVSVYDAVGGSVTTTGTISGLVTSSTARKMQTLEATVEAFELGNGDTVRFQAPAPVQAIIVDLLGGVSGSVSAQFNFVSVGASMTAESGTVRETSHLITLVDGVTPYNRNGYVQLTSTGNTRVLGVTFLCSRWSARSDKWVDAAESGTWADNTFVSGGACRSSSTIGDYVDLDFYGSFVVLNYDKGTSFGKFKWSIDGGAEAEVDCYLNAATTKTDLEIDLDANDWHTIRLEVTAKNAASSGNLVKLGDITKFIGVASPSVDFVAINAGDSIDTRVKYKNADVVKVISGAPIAYSGISESSFTLNGTGQALVKLSR